MVDRPERRFNQRIIDAHQHFWDPSRGDYSWLEPGSALDRPYLPADLYPELEACSVQATIAVQAALTTAETAFLLRLARDPHSRVSGVVGWVDLTSATAADVLDQFGDTRSVVGIRPVLEGDPNPTWLLEPQSIANLMRCRDLGLAVDLLCRPEHLALAVELLELVDGLRLIIDHLGKPSYPHVAEEWAIKLREIASFSETACKISGLVTEIGPGWRPEDFRDHVNHALDSFSPRRCLFGSDWPVATQAATYSEVVSLGDDLFRHLSTEERNDVWGGAAQAFYRLADPEPSSRDSPRGSHGTEPQ